MESSSGSAISDRVMPTRSAAPPATIPSASASSTTRVAAITVSPGTAARIAAAGTAIAFGGVGGGGAIQVEAAGYAEWPSASDT